MIVNVRLGENSFNIVVVVVAININLTNRQKNYHHQPVSQTTNQLKTVKAKQMNFLVNLRKKYLIQTKF